MFINKNRSCSKVLGLLIRSVTLCLGVFLAVNTNAGIADNGGWWHWNLWVSGLRYHGQVATLTVVDSNGNAWSGFNVSQTGCQNSDTIYLSPQTPGFDTMLNLLTTAGLAQKKIGLVFQGGYLGEEGKCFVKRVDVDF